MGVSTCAGPVLGARGIAVTEQSPALAELSFYCGRRAVNRRVIDDLICQPVGAKRGEKAEQQGWEETGTAPLRRWHLSRALKEVRELSRELCGEEHSREQQQVQRARGRTCAASAGQRSVSCVCTTITPSQR